MLGNRQKNTSNLDAGSALENGSDSGVKIDAWWGLV